MERIRKKRMEQFKERISQAKKQEKENKVHEEQEKEQKEQSSKQKEALFRQILMPDAFDYLQTEVKDPRIIDIIERALIMLVAQRQLQHQLSKIELQRIVRRMKGEGPQIRVKRSDDEEAVDLAKKLRLKEI